MDNHSWAKQKKCPILSMAKVEKCSKYLKENGEGRSNGVESEWDFKFCLRVQMVGLSKPRELEADN